MPIATRYRFTLKAGDLAYLDSFSGLVPCKVLKVEADAYRNGDTWATVRVTANRGAYRKGEMADGAVGRFIVSREQIRRHGSAPTGIVGMTEGIVG